MLHSWPKMYVYSLQTSFPSTITYYKVVNWNFFSKYCFSLLDKYIFFEMCMKKIIFCGLWAIQAILNGIEFMLIFFLFLTTKNCKNQQSPMITAAPYVTIVLDILTCTQRSTCNVCYFRRRSKLSYILYYMIVNNLCIWYSVFKEFDIGNFIFFCIDFL